MAPIYSKLIKSSSNSLWGPVSPSPHYLSDFLSHYFPYLAPSVPSSLHLLFLLPAMLFSQIAHTPHSLIPCRSLLNDHLLPRHKIVISKYCFPLKWTKALCKKIADSKSKVGSLWDWNILSYQKDRLSKTTGVASAGLRSRLQVAPTSQSSKNLSSNKE